VRGQQLENHERQPEDDQRAGQQQRRNERLVISLGRVVVTVVGDTAGRDGRRRAQGSYDR